MERFLPRVSIVPSMLRRRQATRDIEMLALQADGYTLGFFIFRCVPSCSALTGTMLTRLGRNLSIAGPMTRT